MRKFKPPKPTSSLLTHFKTSYKILRGFEGTEEVTFFERRVGATRGHDFKLFKKRVNLDAGKFNFGNRVCND